jgi:putative ABC transport system substrate-binding protein
LRDLGYSKGANLILDEYFAEGDTKRLPAAVEQAIASRPDVLVGWEQVALVMRAKTQSIPIVLNGGIDPVAAGLAQSLGRSGTNVTGVAQLNYLLPEKHIDLMREINPRLSRVAMLVDPNAAACGRAEDNARRGASRIGATFVAYAAATKEQLEGAFSQMKDTPPDLLLPCPSPVMQYFREIMIDSVLLLRIPFTSFLVEGEGKGVLFSYADDSLDRQRKAARFVDRVLKGAKPADLPIEQPTKFQLVVNLQTARALGLEIPPVVQVRADRIIE